MARELGMRLPFGSRFEVAEALFTAAGEGGEISRLLRGVENEVAAWAGEYRAWAERYTSWQPQAGIWLSRTSTALQTLDALRAIAAANPA